MCRAGILGKQAGQRAADQVANVQEIVQQTYNGEVKLDVTLTDK